MSARYVHDIDPVIGTLFGVHLWWYGAFYVAGLLVMHVYLRARRAELALSLRAVYTLSVLVVACVLAGGRAVEVAFYEWPHYRHHLAQIPALWLGGMSTHGLLLGALVAIAVFARRERRSFLDLTDALVVPGAFVMAFGRLANFVDGQIVGGLTDVPWAVKFPDADGYRHPVVLYDGLKNLLIVPLLLLARRFDPPRGLLTGLFLFLYAGLRLFVDLFREYPTALFGLATGQVLNLAMAGVGLGLVVAAAWRGRRGASRPRVPVLSTERPARWQPVAFALLLAFALVMPSDWTQDVPARYGQRHPGLTHSLLYPAIAPSP
jgi:phosphatidylglycerol:prolipoprotein diacylglycerol transferase